MSTLPTSALPRCFAIQVEEGGEIKNNKFLYLRSGHAVSEDYATFEEVGIRDPLTSSMHTRFHLVPSKEHGDSHLVHIKSSYNNKYLVAKEAKSKELYKEARHHLLVGTTNEPDERLFKPSCTLFSIIRNHRGSDRVRFFTAKNRPCCFLSGHTDPQTRKEKENIYYTEVLLIDVAEQIILPPYVTFKGQNGMYLRVGDIEGHPYLEFASSYQEDKSAFFSTLNYADGQVSIKSELNGKFLGLSDVWIWADSTETDTRKGHNSFRALKFGNFFVLQSMGNNQFCTTNKKGNTDCLQASSKFITQNAKLALEEPVLSREIYNIKYHRTDHARVYDSKDMNMATASAVNRTSEKNTIKSTLSVTTTASEKHDSTTSHKTNKSVSVTVGVQIKVVNVSIQAQYGREDSKDDIWGNTLQTDNKQEIEYEVTVPAKKKVTLTVTAKHVKCDVPFSYTQRDELPNGETMIYNYDDGLYTGMDCYDLRYHTKEEELEPKQKVLENTKKINETNEKENGTKKQGNEAKKEEPEIPSKKKKGMAEEDTSMGLEEQH